GDDGARVPPIGAERPGLHRPGEMRAQRWVAFGDAGKGPLDRPGHIEARPLGGGSRSPGVAAEAERPRELAHEEVDLLLDGRGAPGVGQGGQLRELATEIVEARLVRSPGARV